MRIGVSVGHHPEAPGATQGLASEYSEASVVAGFVVHYLERLGHQAWLIGSGKLEKKVAEINSLGLDAAVEIHLNGEASGKVAGCETLYAPGSAAGIPLAQSVQRRLISAMNYTDRGIKPGWYRMVEPPAPGAVPDYFLKKTNCPAIIVEPWFITTLAEHLKHNDIPASMARAGFAIATGISAWGAAKLSDNHFPGGQQ